MAYRPMLELLAYLRANGFKTFIVSSGGIEFMRPHPLHVATDPVLTSAGSRKTASAQRRKRAYVRFMAW